MAASRQRGKSDQIDARAIARAALREGLDSLPTAQLAGMSSTSACWSTIASASSAQDQPTRRQPEELTSAGGLDAILAGDFAARLELSERHGFPTDRLQDAHGRRTVQTVER